MYIHLRFLHKLNKLRISHICWYRLLSTGQVVPGVSRGPILVWSDRFQAVYSSYAVGHWNSKRANQTLKNILNDLVITSASERDHNHILIRT